MTTTAKQDPLFSFSSEDTLTGVSRSTTKKRAKEVLPSYEADEGELTKAQLTAIRKAAAQDQAKTVKARLL